MKRLLTLLLIATLSCSAFAKDLGVYKNAENQVVVIFTDEPCKLKPLMDKHQFDAELQATFKHAKATFVPQGEKKLVKRDGCYAPSPDGSQHYLFFDETEKAGYLSYSLVTKYQDI